jgi:hypothetical protein
MPFHSSVEAARLQTSHDFHTIDIKSKAIELLPVSQTPS